MPQKLHDNAQFVLFTAAVVLLWLKTEMVYFIEFDFIPVEGFLQHFLFLVNPLSSCVFFFGLALLFSGKAKKRAFLLIALLLSLVLYANVVYARSFNDFITIPVLFQTKNLSDIGGSAVSLMEFYDVFYFLDVVVLAYFCRKMKNFDAWKKTEKPALTAVFSLALVLFSGTVGLANIERPQLLTRTFDREKLVKLIGAYNYHLYDAILHLRSNAQKAMADSSDLVEIRNYVNARYTPPNEHFFGIAKGKNLIIISMESLQNFVINFEINGKEVTPFLNRLIDQSFYFNNFYHQTGQGKTSDAEFLIDNSLYPLPRGAVFTTNSQNEYEALPERLGNHGYYTAVFHGNNASFWNRDIMYKTLGYDHFFAYNAYEVTPENSVNYGIHDIAFFKQTIPYLKELPQPFYAKLITLTNHFPFTLKNEKNEWIVPEEELFPLPDTNDGTVNRYFRTVHFMDKALQQLIDDLKKSGLYKNSVIVLYGDHYGISENHNEAMSKILGKQITPYDTVQLQKVPLLIHIPGMKGKTFETVSGQIDVKVTLLHLFGIKTKGYIHFGSDLFSQKRPEFAVLRDGSFITNHVVYTEGKCYAKPTGTVVDEKYCEPYKEKAKKELRYSDQIVYGDLLRFLKK